MILKIPLWPTLWTLGGLAFVLVPGPTPPFLVALWATVAIVLWGVTIYGDRLFAYCKKKMQELEKEL